ncbi:MAG: DNA gyrase inhibitor YacG [Beijerinckiaceae bacterium]|nr:DNA gyrase inhibitor YacG [Beijerinckiaceae bacterium]
MAASANDNDRNEQPDPEAVTGKPCPVCRKPALVRYKPFCSRRCADVDLGRWLSGTYAVPATPNENDDDGEDIPEEPRER